MRVEHKVGVRACAGAVRSLLAAGGVSGRSGPAGTEPLPGLEPAGRSGSRALGLQDMLLAMMTPTDGAPT